MKNSHVAFVVALLVAAILIHSGLKSVKRQPSPTQPMQSVQAPPASPTPTVSISKIWPDGATPTKIVHIPDPQQPAMGIMDITLHQSDDLEFDFAPLWYFESKSIPAFSGAEVDIDAGDCFESLQEFQSHMHDSGQTGINGWWSKSRTVRIRLASGMRDNATYSVTIKKASPIKPLPHVLPQEFGNLKVTYDSLHGLGNRKLLIKLTFQNTSTVNTVAVAMYADLSRGVQHNLLSSLIASDGTPYVADIYATTGINPLRSNPKQLTPIGPGQELNTTITFEPRGNLSESAHSFTLQSEIVVNDDYRDGAYDNYRLSGDELPSGCHIANVMFEIPVRRNSEPSAHGY